ncbi:transposable element Tcb2 transposase [Trichonephila clavipes]|nr:transposable element Tcb2 transposase [Trichonephila clavipes]
MMEAGWSSRRVSRQVGHSNLTVRSCCDQWTEDTSFTWRPSTDQSSRRPSHHMTRIRRTNCLIVCFPDTPSVTFTTGPCVLLNHRKVVFSDESRFNLSSDDIRVRVWKTRGECFNRAFALQRPTSLTAGVMVWSAIAYYTRSPLILIHGTLTAHRYVHDILQPHVLPLMAILPGALFQQDNVAHSKDVTTLPPPHYYPSLSTGSPDLSPIKHI